MKRIKLALGTLGLLMVMPFLVQSINQNQVSAVGSPSFSLYEKVHLANDTYTVIGNDGTNVKLLMDTTTGSVQTWGSAVSTATNYPSTTNVGALGSEVLKGKFKLPLSTDLSPITVSNTLNAGVPTVPTGDWWLGDATVDNRNKFMTKDNKDNGEKNLTVTAQDQTTGACSTEIIKEYGIMPTTKKQDDEKKVTLKIGELVKVELTTDQNVELSLDDGTLCDVKSHGKSTWQANTTVTAYYTIKDDKIVGITTDGNKDLWNSAGVKPNPSFFYFRFFNVGKINSDVDATFTATVDNNTCVPLKGSLLADFSGETGPFLVQSLKVANASTSTFKVTATVKNNTAITSDKTCEGQTQNAGTALTRPMATIALSNIIAANTAKRTYLPGNTLSGSFPTSDSGTNKPYVTLLNSNLKAYLTSNATGVNGNVYTTNHPSNGILSLPVTVTGNIEGTRYISASASIGGVTKYGVLKSVTSNNETVSIDLHQFASDPTTLSQIKLTLYQENAGSYKTTYMGNGTEITVNLQSKQEIAFDSKNPTTAEYGTLTELNASLTTPLSKQSSEPIKFSIVSGSATIDSQSYVTSTGIATANIKPTSGTGSVVIAIDKAGDSNATAATRQTYTLTLGKKSMTITPNYTKKIYTVGEDMPAISSKSDDLVNGDTLPTTLVPSLIALDDSAASPSADGKITEIGQWKVVYPDNILDSVPDLTAKYDITLEDYTTNTNYVFETEVSDIPSDWIVVSPVANAQGWWNASTVTLSPSSDATSKGFTEIELVNEAGTVLDHGPSISYSNETTISGVILKVRLKKGDYTSNIIPITLLIDQTKPSVSYTIDKENDWAKSKKIDITIADTLSGIQSVSVERDGTAYTPTVNGNVYSFNADTNGTYTITVLDNAGNETVVKPVVSKIDSSKLSIKATPETLSSDAPKQKITIDYDAGTSGVKSLSVYYKATADEEFTLLDNTLLDDQLDQSKGSMNWYAEMNGYFQFELINNANEKVLSDEIHITQVNPPVPVTQVVAYEKDNKSNSYVCNTWVKHDVTLEITNANTEIDASDQITWEISEDDGTTWKTLSSTTFDVTTGNDTSITKTYQFKAKTDKASEQTPKSFTVKLDKSKPDTPVVLDQEKYTKTDWHAKDITLTINTTPKEHESTETLYVCEGNQSTCQSDPTKWVVNNGTMSFTGNGSHEVYFKVIDEAGNESDVSEAVYVNINKLNPNITIKIETDPVKELLNNATLGFFFNDTVNITIEVDFDQLDTGQTGEVFYIIETDSTKPAPESDDSRWTKGTSTSITPDRKGKIYVKAVSDAGVTSYDDSVLEVFADATPPTITLPSDMTSWTNDPKLEVEVTDALSGIDPKTVKVKEASETAKAFTLQNDKAKITLTKNGAYGVTISASDYSGNPKSEKMKVMIDTEGPEISEPITDTNGYAQERTITFDTSDSLSGLDRASVKNSTGSSVEINDLGNGKYSFTITENDTYTITVSDVAGNISTKDYTEAMLDTAGPIIDKVQISDETEIRPSKSVSFEVSDTPSSVDEVSVTIVVDGVTKTVNVNLPAAGNAYSFTAKENGTYTITASDHAGNTTTREVTVSNIDTSGIRIVNVSDTGTWVKDSMTVSFEVSSSIPLKTGTPTVIYNGAPVTITNEQGIYSFIATENGTYTIDVEDEAGQSDQEVLNITRIDLLPPVIENISDNTTSTEYREPQVISFHIHDYNDTGKTIEGSGLKTGYPKLSITINGAKKDIALRQDASDPSKYSFLAEYNGDYIVELQDQVEHELVRETISVDHILREDQVSPIVVKAYNDATLIASGTWVRKSIRFEISGGLDESVLEKYQVAVTDGTNPIETDWHDVNKGTNKHELTGNIKGDVYWFRAVPVVNQAVISQPFTVNLDSMPPNSLTVKKRSIHSDPISRFINLLSFGNWMKEAQEVSFEAEDNFTDQEDLTYMYYEERNSEKGNWKRYSEPLVYNDTDITLYVKAIDLAGNETEEVPEELKIDSVPPVINGAKDQNEYKYYYLPRYLSVTDQGSGVAKTTYKKDQGSAVDFNKEVSLKEIGTYEIYASDQADNEATIIFKIVPMPELDDIDGTDESKKIIDQVKKELEEVKDKLDANESANYDKWIDDATNKWNSLRKNQLIHQETTTKVEGVGDMTFDPNTELVVEEIKETDLPALPNEVFKTYDVYLRKNGKKVDANGKVKVYLPYDETEEVILYEIGANGEVKEITYRIENGYLVFETDELSSYALAHKEKTKPTPNPDPAPDPVEPTPKPDPEDPDTCPKEINYDSDGDGKPDVNIDLNGDCKAELNIDTNQDFIPNMNIDTKGDGKPTYNVDTNSDGKPDLNIGPIPKPWKPNFCTAVNKLAYCSMNDLIPEINIDTNGDGKPDINIDTDGDGKPDINIDVDGDGKPDVNIDTDGDGKPDQNIDSDGNGVPDDQDDTNAAGDDSKPADTNEPAQANDPEEPTAAVQKPNTRVNGSYTNVTSGIGGASTYDTTNVSMFMILAIGSITVLLNLLVRKKKQG